MTHVVPQRVAAVGLIDLRQAGGWRAVRSLAPTPAVSMASSENKELVRRLIEEAINGRNLDAVDELATGQLALAAKRWIGPFRSSFPDFTMKIVDLVAEGDAVVGHFQCSGTHRGAWNDIPPTRRRFEDIDEIYIFRVREGKLASFVAVEDNLTRLRQLGFELQPAHGWA